MFPGSCRRAAPLPGSADAALSFFRDRQGAARRQEPGNIHRSGQSGAGERRDIRGRSRSFTPTGMLNPATTIWLRSAASPMKPHQPAWPATGLPRGGALPATAPRLRPLLTRDFYQQTAGKHLFAPFYKAKCNRACDATRCRRAGYEGAENYFEKYRGSDLTNRGGGIYYDSFRINLSQAIRQGPKQVRHRKGART